MQVLETILCVILLVMAVFLIVAVLMQQGKNKGLSGTITGSAETFYGKGKGKNWDSVLSKITTVVAIIFAVLVLLVFIISKTPANNSQTDLTDVHTSDLTEEQTQTVEQTSSQELTTQETVEQTTEAQTAEQTTEAQTATQTAEAQTEAQTSDEAAQTSTQSAE